MASMPRSSPDLHGGFDLLVVLLLDAGFEVGGFEVVLFGFVEGQLVERRRCGGERLVLASKVGSLAVDGVDEVPVGGGALGGGAVHVDGGVHGPGVDGQGEVAVDDVDLVAVAGGEGWKEGGVHAGAVGALEVVEADDGDGGGGWAAAGRTAFRGDEQLGVLRDVVGVELGEGLRIPGDQEQERLGGFAILGEGDGDLVVARYIGVAARADREQNVGRQLGAGADKDFDPASKVRRELVRSLSGR